MAAIPDFLSAVHTEIVDDCGPITKLLPALERGFDVILTADDDHVYGDGWAEGLLGHAERHRDAAICYRGRIFEGRRYSESRVIHSPDEPTEVDFITGVVGALYRRQFFGEEIFEEWKEWPASDDIVISGCLKRKEVPMLAVSRPCKVKVYGVQHIDNLWDDGNSHRNDEGLRRMFW